MSLNLAPQVVPAQYESAYRPIVFEWSSSLFPNVTPGESGLFISDIRKPSPAELATWGDLEATDVLMIHAPFSTPLSVGDTVLVELTDNSLYLGVHRVRKVIDTNYTVIDTVDRGAETGGLLSRYYNNYRIFVDLAVESSESVTIKVGPNSVNRFRVDLSDIIQRHLRRPMDSPVLPGLAAASYESQNYVGAEYGIEVYEGWDVPDANGLPVFTISKAKPVLSYKEFYAVNSVHPFAHVSGFNYDDTYDDYIVTQASTGASVKKFLTLAPVEPDLPYNAATDQFAIRIGEADDYFLSYIWKGTGGANISIFVVEYNSSGSLVTTSHTLTTTPDAFGTISVGPAALSLDPSTAYYRVYLVNVVGVTPGVAVTKAGLFYLDTPCTEQQTRFYWLNKLGGTDAYTLHGKKTVTGNTTRQVVRKDTIAVTSPFNGGWNTRTHRVDPQRTVSITSQPLSRDVLRWIGEDMLESVDIRVNAFDDAWAPVIVTSDSVMTDGGRDHQRERVSFDYTLGVDNRSHRG